MPTPTMAMSLEQSLTVEAAPVNEVGENAAMPVIPYQSGELAAELTPTAALVYPIGGLTIDTDTDTILPSLNQTCIDECNLSINRSFSPKPPQTGYTMNLEPTER